MVPRESPVPAIQRVKHQNWTKVYFVTSYLHPILTIFHTVTELLVIDPTRGCFVILACLLDIGSAELCFFPSSKSKTADKLIFSDFTMPEFVMVLEVLIGSDTIFEAGNFAFVQDCLHVIFSTRLKSKRDLSTNHESLHVHVDSISSRFNVLNMPISTTAPREAKTHV
jgi:hypothetical protein